ncbi:MAG TPA: imidazolonepropionase [Candidatus Polarisedimenticolia bacterium]|nr:imidazolonepropionase [Candidatus Polarisedimenticolia bacterium]
MIRADFALRHAGQLATMVPAADDPLGRIRDGALAAREGRVVWIGEDRQLESQVTLDGDLLDAQGACVIPGLVDAHTHPVFAGSRADEFAERLSGVPHASQQSGERGIGRTVRATREADGAMLLGLAQSRANRFLANGTTTIEAKTGYGLDLDNEAKSLDVLRNLAGRTPLRVVPTFLGAHVPPPGVDRDDYVRSLIDEMLPAFRPWAVFCDVWCEAPAFTPKETRAILTRARTLGYGLRVHAAQLAPGEGPEIAAELGASSADHLEFATPAQIRALAQAGTVAVLCPGANFTTHGPRPPIEAMRQAKLPMAVASDLNPGTSNSESLPNAMSLACVQWGMTPVETLIGATVHAARSLKLDGVAGCLRVGGFADCAILDVETPEAIPYYVGVNRVITTVAGGVVWQPS